METGRVHWDVVSEHLGPPLSHSHHCLPGGDLPSDCMLLEGLRGSPLTPRQALCPTRGTLWSSWGAYTLQPRSASSCTLLAQPAAGELTPLSGSAFGGPLLRGRDAVGPRSVRLLTAARGPV